MYYCQPTQTPGQQLSKQIEPTCTFLSLHCKKQPKIIRASEQLKSTTSSNHKKGIKLIQSFKNNDQSINYPNSHRAKTGKLTMNGLVQKIRTNQQKIKQVPNNSIKTKNYQINYHNYNQQPPQTYAHYVNAINYKIKTLPAQQQYFSAYSHNNHPVQTNLYPIFMAKPKIQPSNHYQKQITQLQLNSNRPPNFQFLNVQKKNLNETKFSTNGKLSFTLSRPQKQEKAENLLDSQSSFSYRQKSSKMSSSLYRSHVTTFNNSQLNYKKMLASRPGVSKIQTVQSRTVSECESVSHQDIYVLQQSQVDWTYEEGFKERQF